ncbi:ABC-type transport auxiliary lipoprotein family protein [Dokdonella sp.]|uniref:ABC-type transport auxiliary lipoprotein family protein n=1 Tax=Dokdonella sp. TaxID=2291710 RepID=UPI003C6635EC
MIRTSRFLLPGLFALLAACSALGGKHTPFAVYAPQLDLPASDAGGNSIQWQLLVDTPRTSAALDTNHIAVMPSAGLIEVYPAARWRDSAPILMRSLIVLAFDNDGRIGGVSAADAGLSGDYVLSMELRGFQVEMAGADAQATIRLTAKLFDHSDNRIVATRTFDATAPAASTEVADAVKAFEQALDEMLPKLVDWTIEQGNLHEDSKPATRQ